MRRITFLVLSLVSLMLTGCNTLRIELADADFGSANRVEDRHDYWLWGGFPSDVRVDLHEYCPDGTAVIEESIRPQDAAMTLLTLTIWSPRTAVYTCRAAEGAS